jgi:hypothetical protein
MVTSVTSKIVRKGAVRLLAVTVFSLMALAHGLTAPSDAFACDEYTQFMANTASFNAQTSHGVLADLHSQDENFTACDSSDTGGTVNFQTTLTQFNWIEIGWEETHSRGYLYDIFTEWGKNNVSLACGGGKCTHSSGCLGDGQVTTFKVVWVGAPNDWQMAYACDGGGYTSYYTNDLSDSEGVATVEAFRRTDWAKAQRYTSTEVKTVSDAWYFWSDKNGAVCDTTPSYDPPWAFQNNNTDDYSAVASTTGICSSH